MSPVLFRFSFVCLLAFLSFFYLEAQISCPNAVTACSVTENASLPEGEHHKWADLTNDGLLDLVQWQQNDLSTGELVYYINTGSGYSANNMKSVVTGFVDYSVRGYYAIGDLNSDLLPDLLAVRQGMVGYNLEIYFNQGNNIFNTVNLPGFFPYASIGDNQSIADPLIGDVDNDGDQDIIFCTDQCYLYWNLGQGQFEQDEKFCLDLDFGAIFTQSFLADFDNDGYLDLIGTQTLEQGEFTSHTVRWFSGVGIDCGHCLDGESLAANFVYDIGDIDNDGDLDLLVQEDVFFVQSGGGNSTGTKILLNNYPGFGFTELQINAINNCLNDVYDAQWVDIDNDGDLDIGAYDDIGVCIFRNDNLDFFKIFDFSQQFPQKLTIAFGDYNHDNQMDFCGLQYDGESYSTYYCNFQNCGTNERPRSPDNLTHLSYPGHGDVLLQWEPASDNNQDDDGLTYNLSISNGLNIVSPLSSQNQGVREIVQIGAQSQNNFHYLHDLRSGTYDWKVQAIDHSYTGGFWSQTGSFTINNCLNFDTVSLGSGGAYQIQLAELFEDNSQLMDLVVSQGSLSIFENLGELNLGQIRTLENNNQVLVRDLNGDNLLDLVFYSSSVIEIYLNNGSGGFSEAMNQSISAGKPVIGDFDNDGDRDILFGDGMGNIFRILNLGEGKFSLESNLVFRGSGGNREMLELFDVDLDGDLDLLTKFTADIQVGFGSFYNLEWFENINGSFGNMTTIANSLCGPVSFGDIDGDGDKDLVHGKSDLCSIEIAREPGLSIYLNADGRFSEEAVLVHPCDYFFSELHLGDMDNDGKLDIIGIVHQRSSVFENIEPSLVVLRNDLTEAAYQFTRVYQHQFIDVFALGDLDGDMDLDIVFPSCESSCLEALVNQICIPNTGPTPPQNVTCTQEEDGILLTWEPATDEQQDAASLTYNIQVYSYDSSGSYIISPESYTDSGVRKIVRFGDQCHNLSWRIYGLTEGNYCFRVQAVDHSYTGGPWSEEACCTNEICKDAIPVFCGLDTIGDTADEGLRDRINDYIWCETSGYFQPELIYRIERDTNDSDSSDIFISLQELGEETQAGLDVFIIENCNSEEEALVRCVEFVERTDTSGPALIQIIDPNPESEYFVIVDSKNTPGDFRLSTSCLENCSDADAITCQEQRMANNNTDGTPKISAYYNPQLGSYYDRYVGYDYKVEFTASKTGIYTISLDSLRQNLDLFILSECNPFECVASSLLNGVSREEIEISLEADQTIYLVVDAFAGISSDFKLMVDCCHAEESTVYLSDETTEAVFCKRDGQMDTVTFYSSVSTQIPYAYLLTDEEDLVIAEITNPFVVSNLNRAIYRVYGVSFENELLVVPGENVNGISADICVILSDNYVELVLDSVYEINLDTVLCVGDQLTVCDTILNTSGQHQIICQTLVGCDSIINVNITYDTVQASIEGNRFFCAGEQTTLTAQPADYTYQWSIGSVDQSILVALSGTYSLTVTSENGCFDTTSVFISEVEELLPSLGNDTILCEGETFLLNPGDFDTYRWSTGDSVPFITISTEGTYSVTVTNTAGCVGTSDVIVSYLSVPIANAGTDITICAGECVTLRGSGGANCLWLFSDDEISGVDCDLEVCPLDASIYTLIVSNKLSNTTCADTATVMVMVNAKPEIKLVPDTAICSGIGIALVQNLTNCEACSCVWTIDGNSTALNCDPVVFPLSNTNYQVITTNGNACRDTAMVSIEVGETPVAVVDQDQINLCPGECVILNSASEDNCIWMDSGGNFLADDCMLGEVCPNVSSVYTLINSKTTNVATVMETLTCYDTIEVQVNVFDEVGGITLIEDTVICSGARVELVRSIACTDCICDWTPSNGLDTSMNCAPVASPDQSTVYRVTSVSPEGCSSSDSVSVMVVESPVADLEFDEASICRGDILTLSGSGGDCRWLDGDQQVFSTNCDFEVSPDSTIAYLLEVSNTGEISCSDTAIVLISVTEPPLIELIQDTTICHGTSLALLQSSDCPDCDCTWSTSTGLDDPNSCDPMASPGSDITYELVAVKNGVCEISESVDITVLPSLPIIVLNDELSVFKNNTTTLPVDEVLLKNDTFTRINQIGIELSQENLPSEISVDIDGGNLVITTGSILGLYEFGYTLIDLDCGSQDMGTVLIQVIETDKVSVCNPDIDDGCLVLNDIDLYPQNDIAIFDREGNIVHLKSTYLNDWDGTNIRTGERVPTGAYYFVLNLGQRVGTTIDAGVIRGVITILRR